MPRKRSVVPPPLYLVLDLEAVTDPDLKDQEKDKQGKERFPPPPAHQIVCVGFAFVEDLRVVEWGVLGDEGELVTLQKLTNSIDTADPCIVTMNGRHYDMPVIAARCMRRGVPFPWYYRTRTPRHRYSQESHLDLMDYLADHGAGPRAALDVWARLVGWPGKQGADGAGVAALFETGGFSAVADYCMGDICQTVAIFLRAELVRGRISLADYQVAAAALLDHAEADPRTAALAFGVDRPRWLLEEQNDGDVDIDEEETEAVREEGLGASP